MKTAKAAGFDRGAADKIAERPMDPTPPASYAGAKVDEYRRGYRKGYAETRLAKEIVGASASVSSASRLIQPAYIAEFVNARRAVSSSKRCTTVYSRDATSLGRIT